MQIKVKTLLNDEYNFSNVTQFSFNSHNCTIQQTDGALWSFPEKSIDEFHFQRSDEK